ncbi:MAG: hypothetical protein JXK94_09830 [Deltaproteobacteria bacterium]|nr:hypothetical protein [Deltaproteobacteria bacterium]
MSIRGRLKLFLYVQKADTIKNGLNGPVALKNFYEDLFEAVVFNNGFSTLNGWCQFWGGENPFVQW